MPDIPPPWLLLYAKVMMGIFTCLGIWSLFSTAKAWRKPIEQTKEEFSKAKKAFLLSSWVLLSATATAVNAISSGQYFLLFPASLLFSFCLPIVVWYLRVRSAVKRLGLSQG
jgi:hypothetical protein